MANDLAKLKQQIIDMCKEGKSNRDIISELELFRYSRNPNSYLNLFRHKNGLPRSQVKAKGRYGPRL